jgi:hypothetical protein
MDRDWKYQEGLQNLSENRNTNAATFLKKSELSNNENTITTHAENLSLKMKVHGCSQHSYYHKIRLFL